MKIRRRDSGRESVAAERAELEPTSPLWGEHRSRYHLAAPLAFNRTVLDVACGSGFGSQILAEAGAAHVIAADLSSDAFGSALVDNDVVKFVQADATILQLKNGVVDLVVSFETIEHFEEGDGFVGAIKNALRPGGTLLISTPNRLFTQRLKGPPNPFHVQEYTPEEFQELLARHFDHVELKGQHVDPRFPVCPYWKLPDESDRSVRTRLRTLWWKLQSRLPYTLKDRLSRLTHNRGFYPGEFDFVLTDDLESAHVLVGRCEVGR